MFDPLKKIADKEYIYIIGAGGKTTFTKYVCSKFLSNKKKCIISTTTKFFYTQFLNEYVTDEREIYNGCCYVKSKNSDNKLLGFTTDHLDSIYYKYDYSIIVEADGARTLPLKYPADYEPVVSNKATKVFLILGLDSLNKRFNEYNFHRIEIFKKKHPEYSNNFFIDFNIFFSIISDYYKKNNADNFYVLLNKFDKCEYKKNQIIDYFNEKDFHYAISSLEENKIEWIK